MRFDLILMAAGLVVLVVQMILPLRWIGYIGSALVVGGASASFAPDHFWLAFALGAVASIGIAQFVVGFVCQLAEDFTTLASSASSFIGRDAVVVRAIEPGADQGMVQIDGEMWPAYSTVPIASGSNVIVERMDGSTAYVRRER